MNNDIHLAIVGSRKYNDADTFCDHVDAWIKEHGKPKTIISGGAAGADTLAALYARAHNISLTLYQPDWKQFGRAAGPKRNQQIVDACSHVLAFPSQHGRGTQDTMRKANRANKPVSVHYVD